MSKIKKTLKEIVFLVGIILLPIIILMCLLIGFIIYWAWNDGSDCWDKWGYEKEWYTMNCVMCLENKGCVSVKVLEQIERDVCGGYPYQCTVAQELEVAKRECEIYGGVVNIELRSCYEKFELKNCGKLKGYRLYPKECGLPPEMTY